MSGVRPEDLQGAPQFKEVQAEVSELLKGRIVVGHAIKHDFKVLFLDHPKKMIRDTSKYKPFRAAFGGRTPSLKNLSERFLGVAVQTGEHSSVQDSQVSQYQDLVPEKLVHFPIVFADKIISSFFFYTNCFYIEGLTNFRSRHRCIKNKK